jgi:hypothetical protein
MTRRIERLVLRAALLLAPLCGCDLQSPPVTPPSGAGVVFDGGWGLATPGTIGAFTRVDIDPPAHPERGITAGYSHLAGDEPVIATMSVRPRVATDVLLPAVSLGGGGVDGGSSAQALALSIAQVRRFYPKATVLTQTDTFLVQRGALQQGKMAVLGYQELHAGQERPMRLRVYSFCCVGGQWAYEYRFRYPATVDDDFDIAVFLRESSWTVAPPS